jgi:hypothetical protein
MLGFLVVLASTHKEVVRIVRVEDDATTGRGLQLVAASIHLEG